MLRMTQTILKTTLIIGASICLSGCFEAHKDSGRTDVSLEAFKRISFVCKQPVSEDGKLVDCGPDSDTAETVTEIREHNAVYDALKADEAE
jgi:hypothetical protein